MKRVSYFPFALLFLSLFALVSLPTKMVEKMRSQSVGIFSPSWRMMHSVRNYILNVPTLSGRTEPQKIEESELALENQKLKAQLDAVYEWLLFHERIESDVEKIKALNQKAASQELFWREFFQRRGEELKKVLEMQVQTLPARVIYREPSSWSSSLWLNVGERDNEALGKLVVAKNSPVLVGNALVGLVEYVDKKRCRVRLITDSGLVPSVRVLRGKTQDLEVLQHVESLHARLSSRDDLFENNSEKSVALQFLAKIKEKLYREEDSFLAKGEVMGSSLPLWRSRGQTLKGRGFNYDYADLEGPARELRSGRILDKTAQERINHEAILKAGDLLVTTGLDGVFPAGLNVGIVSEVIPLEDGAYAYEIEARPCANNLDELSTLFVLPPQEN
jgi:rod shape-determining protein MreC